MVAQAGRVPSTPMAIRTRVSVEEIDYERRLRRERLHEAKFTPSPSNRGKRANPAHPLVDEDSRSSKRRCALFPFTEDNNNKENSGVRSWDSRVNLAPSCSNVQHFRNQTEEPVIHMGGGIRSRWQEAVSYRNLKPRNLCLDLEATTSRHEKLETPVRKISITDPLPYMPL